MYHRELPCGIWPTRVSADTSRTPHPGPCTLPWNGITLSPRPPPMEPHIALLCHYRRRRTQWTRGCQLPRPRGRKRSRAGAARLRRRRLYHRGAVPGLSRLLLLLHLHMLQGKVIDDLELRKHGLGIHPWTRTASSRSRAATTCSAGTTRSTTPRSWRGCRPRTWTATTGTSSSWPGPLVSFIDTSWKSRLRSRR